VKNISKKDNLAVLFFFFLFALSSIFLSDYGSKNNQFDYLLEQNINHSDFSSFQKRNSINGDRTISEENLNKWLMRFRLYSIDADEVNTIMALSRIKPDSFKFDPHHYSYGGGYLYPLGAWFYLLKSVDLIEVGNLGWMIQNPKEMSKIYRAGRIFTSLAFFLSVIVFYFTLRLFFDVKKSFIGALFLLFSPIFIMFSITLKPYAYALFWSNLAIFIVAKNFVTKKVFKQKEIIALGVLTGMAVGSVSTFSIFAVLIWLFILFQEKSNKSSYSQLLLIPFYAFMVFFITNPYIFINYQGFLAEKSAQASWFYFGTELLDQYNFFRNSVIPGFGVTSLILLFVLIKKAIKSYHYFLVFLCFVSVFIFIASVSASISSWHINARYILFLLPLIILFSIESLKKKWQSYILLVLTLLQSVPMVLAYNDENTSSSTRIQAAKWINSSIQENTSICTGGRSIAPYDSPPFNFKKFLINNGSCEYLINVERQTDNLDNNDKYELVKRFQPRLNLSIVPLVFSHINPQISIYKKVNRDD